MSIAAALLDDVISNRVIATLENKLAPLAGFSSDFSDAVESRKSAKVTVGLSSGNAVATSPTDYEVGDTNLSEVDVTLAEKSVSWSITNADYNATSIAKLENNFVDNINNLADGIFAVCTALMTTANYGAMIVDKAQASFGAADMKTVWAALPKAKRRTVVLDTTAYSNIIPVDKDGFELNRAGAYGFEGIHHATLFTGMQANGYGFVADPRAMAVASKVPDIAPAVRDLASEVRDLTVPSLGLTVRFVHWGSTKTRKEWASVGVYFGAGVGRAEALKIIGDTP